MASLCSKDTSNKDKHASDQHISDAVKLYKGSPNIEVSPGMVSQKFPPETESANKKSKLSCASGDKLFEYKPFQIEEWIGTNFRSTLWESSWVKYLNHNSRVFVQGKDFVKPHTLCLVCKTICTDPKLLSGLLDGKWDGLDCDDLDCDEPCPRRYETIEEFNISASKGCHMCTMILHGLWTTDVHCCLLFDLTLNEPKAGLMVGPGPFGFFKFYPHSNPKLQRSLYSTQSKVFESPTENTSQWRTSTLSEEAFQLARSWLTECTSHHEGCNKLTDFHDFPSRLIHIAGEDNQILKVGLRVSKDLISKPKYLTLSHVWGDIKNRFTLNAFNFEGLVNEGICWQRLPKTFQDAILITYKLGFEYLWIDCLCIIQDSREDWKKEAPRMASIYGNSTCNIAALGKDSHAGCFRDRNPLSYSPCRIFSNEHGDIYFHTDSEFNDNFVNRIKDAPLFKRAWIFQERILAQRNIYYGDSQIHWECSQGSACEIAPTIISSKEITPTHSLTIGTKNNISILRGCIDDLKENEVQAVWQDIINAYHPLLLTEATDKLIALSAITNLFEKRFGLTYLDGLWKEHLPGALLWYIRSPLLKYSVIEVPSWSWAAMKTTMESRWLYFLPRSVDNQNTKMDAKVLGHHEVRNVTIDSDLLGDLPRFSLTLRGWIKPVKYLMRKCLDGEFFIAGEGMSKLSIGPRDFISVDGKKLLGIDWVYLDTPLSQMDDASCTPCETDPDFYYQGDNSLEEPLEGLVYAKKRIRKVCLMLIYTGSNYDTEGGLILEEYGTTPNHYIRKGFFAHARSKVERKGQPGYRSLFGAEESDTEERTIELF